MTNRRLGFGAVTLDRSGGGIATASRLMWQVMRERWGAGCRLVTLIDRVGQPADLHPSTAGRLRFGAALAADQALGRVDAVFYSHLSLGKVQYWMPSAFRRPYGVFLHGIEVWRPLSDAERQVLSGAALLVANSGYTARRVKDVHPWIGPIADCPLALPETDRVSGQTADRGRHAASRPTVLIVARMSARERYKGHDQILDAWPAVRSRVPNAQFVIVGEGDDAPRLKKKAADLGLGDSVVFTGFVTAEELGILYGSAAVFAMPSREEGFGLVYLEAMSYGIPCIGSIHDAAAGVIADGVTGYLVDQADIRQLTDRMIGLLTDSASRSEMGANGRRRVEEQFTYGHFRDRLVALLEAGFEAGAGVTVPARSERSA